MLLLFLLGSSFPFGNAFSQTTITVSGTVTDQTGENIPGASVKVKGTQISTQTNNSGQYTIKVPSGQSVLVFSYVGYYNQEQKVGSNRNINISLKENYENLNDVVIVGYGTQKKREITGSIGSIKADQIDQFAGGSLNTSLQGKIAGLQITTNSGEPGAGANITLRGASSINGSSQPLFIIDGIPVNNDSYQSLNDGASFSPLNDINPSDIASIEVLKDAATASIYGSRASNGVIIITTKKGLSGSPVINFNLNSSWTELTRKVATLNAVQFRDAFIEAIYNSTGALTTKVSVIDSLNPIYRDSYNWQDIMYRQAFQTKYDVSVSGASKEKNVDYFISAGYRNLQPVVTETKYNQVFGSARLNYKITKAIKGSTNFNLSNYGYNRQDNNIISRYLGTLPVYGPYDPITGEIVPLFEGSKTNPLAQALYAKNEIKRWRLLAKQELGLEISKGLEFRTNISLDYSNTNSSYFSPPILSTNASSKSVFSDFRPELRTSFTNENYLTYKLKIKKDHNLDLLLGQSYQLFKSNSTYVRGIDNIDNQITSINGSSKIISFSQSEQENLLLSFFGKANYNYKGKYLFSVLVRQDGSSRFGDNNRTAYFPAFSAGWLFSQESFMKDYDWLNEGKIRASYGITGNQNIGNYAAQGALVRAGTYLNQTAIVADGLPNPDLKWETTKQLDLGLDLAFLKGRINFTADYYDKRTKDLLFDVQIPAQTGYSSLPFNFGGIANKGFEFAIDAVIIPSAFKWSTSFTFGLNRNTVTNLPDNQDYRPNAFNLARIGQAVGVFYGYKALGVYARDEDNIYIGPNGTKSQYRMGSSIGAVYKGGDVIYEDLNGDGVINIDDQQIIGNPTPKSFGGLQNTFSYKGFQLSFFFNYVLGNDIFNNLIRSIDGSQFDTNYSTNQLRRWRKQGDVTDIPRLVKGDPMQNYAVSSRFLEDGSFIRLQNVSLGYSLPQKFIKGLGVSAVNFGVSAQNLLTFGSYTGYDPEVSSGNNPLGFGVDNGAFPKTRSYNLSLNVKF
ncbi:hypothetical protein ASG14_06980 [Pedobacter sp. Leaf194]|nr:hypothetical protein ASG14_06980 [Pedobacter sp. Leaf194]